MLIKQFSTPVTLMIAIAVGLSLAGCGKSVKKSLGMERTAPDEFAVYKRAPLTLPPDYNLRAPEPGKPRPQETQVVETAKQIVVQESELKKTDSNRTAGELILLEEAGAGKADKSIRETLREEYGVVPETEMTTQSVIQKLMGKDDSPKGKTIDASEEAGSLREKGIRTTGPVEINKPVNQVEIPLESSDETTD